MYRGSRVRSPPEADTFTAVHREFVGLVRYDFNRLAVYLSFRTPIGGKLPRIWQRHCMTDGHSVDELKLPQQRINNKGRQIIGTYRECDR